MDHGFVRKTRGGLGRTQGTVQQNVDCAVGSGAMWTRGKSHRKWSILGYTCGPGRFNPRHVAPSKHLGTPTIKIKGVL